MPTMSGGSANMKPKRIRKPRATKEESYEKAHIRAVGKLGDMSAKDIQETWSAMKTWSEVYYQLFRTFWF